jgi:heat shock protein HslJ
LPRRRLAAALVLLAAACAKEDPVVERALTPAPPDPPRVVPLEQIVAKKWVVDSIEPSAVNDFAWSRLGISLVLDGRGSASGYAGCNQWSAGYLSTRPGVLSFEPPVATRMYCAVPDGVMDREAEFLAAIGRVRGYSLSEDHLLVELDGGRMVLIRDNP